jgi:hypothetical protein
MVAAMRNAGWSVACAALVAGCSSSTAPARPAVLGSARPTTAAPAGGEVPASAEAAAPAPAPAPAASPPPPAMLDAAALTALASVKVAGRVVLDGGAMLYASRAAAAAHVGDPFAAGTFWSARVLHDDGDVVELETSRDDKDCVDAPRLGYTLRVFVPRSQLVPRLDRTITQEYADGSAWLLEAGAPIAAFADGAVRPIAWPASDAGATVPADAVTYGVVPSDQRTYLLRPDNASPASCPTPAEERASQRSARAAAERAEVQREEARARCEADNAAAEAKRKRIEKKQKSGKELSANDTASILVGSLDCNAMLDLLAVSTGDVGLAPDVARCTLETAAPSLTVNGAAALAPDAIVHGHAPYQIDRTGDGAYLVGVDGSCGRVRAIGSSANIHVPRDDGSVRAGIGGLGPRDRPTRYRAKQGAKVTWAADGTTAGTATGGRVFDDKELRRDGKLACFTLPTVAGELCHRAKDLESVY